MKAYSAFTFIYSPLRLGDPSNKIGHSDTNDQSIPQSLISLYAVAQLPQLPEAVTT